MTWKDQLGCLYHYLKFGQSCLSWVVGTQAWRAGEDFVKEAIVTQGAQLSPKATCWRLNHGTGLILSQIQDTHGKCLHPESVSVSDKLD